MYRSWLLLSVSVGAAATWVEDKSTLLEQLPDILRHNVWIRPEHAEHVAKFVQHIVAASFANPESVSTTPEGYRVLSYVAPHPVTTLRARTAIDAEIASIMPNKALSIFAAIVFRYHNTGEAWAQLKPRLLQYVEHRDLETLRQSMREMYAGSEDPSYLFSIGDGIRHSGPHSWREAAVTALEAHWGP